MFILSISYKTADFEVKSSFNTLKLIFYPENVYLISCMIYFKNINTNNQNNLNNVH